MRAPIRYFLLLLGLCLVPPVFATDTHSVKCAVNQDRVWVYESLNSFDVEARLKCGEPVEILSRVKGFVKIRTTSGVEGYVPDSVFSDLPVLPDEINKPAASTASQRRATSIAVHATVASSHSDSASTTSKSASAPASVAPPVPAPAKASTGSIVPKPSPRGANTVAKKSNATDSAARPSTRSAHAASSAPNSLASSKAPVPAAAPVSAKMEDSAASAPPAEELTTTQPAAADAESEDYPDAKPENESADPSCRLFFSAYGLAPSQYKWLAENRRKQHASICPAPNLGRVDYVILFAHDSDTYSVAMPVPVHTDRSGFSDFNPMTTVDTALMPASEVEKARYEFVWVFRMKRGDFDPARFSQRRRPQFTTYVKGSHAPERAAEDAFSFIHGQSPDR